MLDINFFRKGMSFTFCAGHVRVALRLFLQRRNAMWYMRAWTMFMKVPFLDIGVVFVW
jgi:hypothetical protein